MKSLDSQALISAIYKIHRNADETLAALDRWLIFAKRHIDKVDDETREGVEQVLAGVQKIRDELSVQRLMLTAVCPSPSPLDQ